MVILVADSGEDMDVSCSNCMNRQLSISLDLNFIHKVKQDYKYFLESDLNDYLLM